MLVAEATSELEEDSERAPTSDSAMISASACEWPNCSCVRLDLLCLGVIGNLHIERMRDPGGQYLRIYIRMPPDDHRLSLAETEMEVDEVMPSV